MRRTTAVLGVLALVGCGGMRDMFNAHVDVVASVGDRTLGAQRLADLFIDSPGLNAQADVMARVAHLWVNYVLFADRVLAGDSLLDSTSVVEANWQAVHQILIGRFHDQLVAQRPPLDSARLDSIYGAGELRFIRHVLVRADTTMTPAQVQAKRRQAERIRSQLVAGGSWERANRASEDSTAKAQNGALGVIARGETVEPFEEAAFALAPGELAPVTATQFGFHVLQRPPLGEVRASFQRGVEQRVMAWSDSTYLAGLSPRLHLQVRSSSPAAARDVARDPLEARQSRRVLASFDGGRLTAGDLARWLDVLPPRTTDQILGASDDDLKRLVEALARNAMLLVEARGSGVQMTDQELQRMRADLARQTAALRQALQLDSLAAADTAAGRPRARLAGTKVDAYLQHIAENPQIVVPVPLALADHLRERAGWRVYPAGVQRAFDLARGRQAALDSAAGRLPAGGGPR